MQIYLFFGNNQELLILNIFDLFVDYFQVDTLYLSFDTMNLKEYIREIPDFPKPGINFKDITPLLSDHKALINAIDGLVDLCPENIHIDKVIGIESRGFILAPMLASKLNAGFVPVRKSGKLPFKVKSKSYDLEYGQDTLEIHEDAITKGENILIHDDVLATGGTARAVSELVQELGGNIIQCNFILELSFLQGRQKLNVPTTSLLNY